MKQDHRLPVVSRLGEQALRLLEVLPHQPLRAEAARVGRLADEERGAGAPRARDRAVRLLVGRLVRHDLEGPAGLHVVERRVQVVDDQPRLPAEVVGRLHGHPLVRVQHRHEVRGHVLDKVDLARDEGVRGGLGVGDVVPDEAIEVDDLAARGHARGLAARDVGLVLLVDHLAPRHPLVLEHPEGARAGHLLDLLVRVGLRDPLRHHERDVGVHLPEGGEGHRPRLLQGERDGAVVRRLQLLGLAEQELSHRVPLPPSADGRDAVRGRDRASVVPREPVAQGDGVDPAVVAHRVPRGHLRLGLEVRVRPEEGVVDRVAVVAGDEGGGPDRIDVLEIRVDGDVELALAGGGERKGEAEAERGGREGAAHAPARADSMWVPHVGAP